jgi:hypothetical protein
MSSEGISAVKNAYIIRGRTINGYVFIRCPYCNEVHGHWVRRKNLILRRNSINSYKVAKCSNNNVGYHYYICYRQRIPIDRRNN